MAVSTRQTRDWPEVIQRQQASGLSVKEFCEQERPKLTTTAFYTAKKKLKASSAGNGRGRTQPRFTPQQMLPKGATSAQVGGLPSFGALFTPAEMAAADTLRLIVGGNIRRAIAVINAVAGLPTA